MPELLPRTANGRATRRRILDSATALVMERGVAAVALDDVRERSRTSKSQLYLYFPGRRELLRAVARNTACLVLGAQDGHVEAGFGQVERFEAWCDDVVAAQAGPHGRRGCPLGGLVAQLSEHDDETRAVLAEAFAAWERPLADGFRAMADRDELRPGVDPDDLATAVMASLQGGLLLTQLRRDARQVRIALDGALAQIAAARRPAGEPAAPGPRRTDEPAALASRPSVAS